MTQINAFQASTRLVRHMIERQAGSLEKSVMELVQNSIDADATVIEINIAEDLVTVKDNGGGMNLKVIKTRFETFGFEAEDEEDLKYDKSKDDSTIGEFCIGRGQVFAQGATIVRTGDYYIHVDYLNQKVITYDLDQAKNYHPGTCYWVYLYETKRLNETRINEIVETLKSSFYFPEIDIIINGNKINMFEKEDERREYSCDDVVVIIEPASISTKIYVKGMFVKTTRLLDQNYKIFVNKGTLEMSRKDFIHDEIYKKFIDCLQQINVDDLATHQKNEPYRNDFILLDLLESKKITSEDIMDVCFIKSFDSSGYYSPNGLIKISKGVIGDISGYPYEKKSKAGGFLKNEVGYPIADLSFMVKRILIKIEEIKFMDMNKIDIAQKIKDKIERGFDILPQSSKKKDRFMVSVCEIVSYLVSEKMGFEYREIAPVKDASFNMATDGEKRIWVNWEVVQKYKYEKPPIVYSWVFKKILHEYCHNEDSTSDYGHDLEFYEMYHNMVQKNIFEKLCQIPLSVIYNSEENGVDFCLNFF